MVTTELKELPGLSGTPGMARFERDLHLKLREVTENREDVLVRNLAQARLEADFGLCYSNIFGSQLAGLMELDARRRVSASRAYDFYIAAERAHPDVYKDYGFTGWLGFLKSNNLVDSDGEDIVMTDIGSDFLLWLRTKRLSVNRPF